MGSVYVHILYIRLKLKNEFTVKNEFTGHVFILIVSDLIQHVLRSKNSLNCFTTFGSSGSFSWELFGTEICLPHGQLKATVEGTASLIQF